jgi:hypothetical protein
MSILSKLLRHALRKNGFLRDEAGTIIVDAVLILPAFIWAYAGLFAYWDSYRTINTVQKVSYTVSDLISRSQGPIDDAFIGGMRDTMNYMLDSDQAGEIRVTSYQWIGPASRYEVIFSRSTNAALPVLTTADLANLTTRLPLMSDGDSAVLLETRVPYSPPMAFGLQPTTIEEFIVTRQRFLPRLCHVDVEC